MAESRPDKTVATAPALPSYASGTSTLPLIATPSGRTWTGRLGGVGDHEALVECATGRRFSYPELVEEVNACALGLDSLGVAKGDPVGIWAPNCAEWVFVQYGTASVNSRPRLDQHSVHLRHHRLSEGRHTTCLTTRSLLARAAATRRPTGCASRCPTTTASVWAWATSAAPRTAPP
jgi:hypothetical protein